MTQNIDLDCDNKKLLIELRLLLEINHECSFHYLKNDRLLNSKMMRLEMVNTINARNDVFKIGDNSKENANLPKNSLINDVSIFKENPYKLMPCPASAFPVKR